MKEPKRKTLLHDKPEYLVAIGTLSVEIVNLEILLADFLVTLLKIPDTLAHEIYFTPRSHIGRMDILEHVATVALNDEKFKEHHDRILSLVKRAKGAANMRNLVVHSVWGLSDTKDFVTKRSLPLTRPSAVNNVPAPLSEITDEIIKVRFMFEEIEIAYEALANDERYEPWHDIPLEQVPGKTPAGK